MDNKNIIEQTQAVFNVSKEKAIQLVDLIILIQENHSFDITKHEVK